MLRTEPARLSSIDAMRGLAAFFVVTCHFPMLIREVRNPAPLSEMPLYPWLSIPYQFGWMAVDLFFIISGLVFFSVYLQGISSQKIGWRKFFVARVSRLAPLHWLTLLIVAALQIVHQTQSGHSLLYFYNDGYHFALNVFGIQSWGLERGYSFNGPAWSISVECLVYVVFFVVANRKITSPNSCLILIAIAVIALGKIYSPISRGISFFFMGGLVFYASNHITKSNNRATIARWIKNYIATWIAIIAGIQVSTHLGFTNPLDTILDLLRVHGHIRDRLAVLMVQWAFFPAIVLWGALRGSSDIPNFLKSLGDISYSIYLIHFPLLLLTKIALSWGLPIEIQSTWALISYLIAVLTLGWISFHFFESPIQAWMRRKWQPKLSGN